MRSISPHRRPISSLRRSTVKLTPIQDNASGTEPDHQSLSRMSWVSKVRERRTFPCAPFVEYQPVCNWHIRAGIQSLLATNGSSLLNSRLLGSVLLSRQVRFSVWVAEGSEHTRERETREGRKSLPLLRRPCASILVDAVDTKYAMT